MVAVNYLWNPLNDNIVREFDDAGAVVAEYTTEPEHFGNVISQRRDAEDDYFHYDGVGSTLAVSNQAGTVTDTRAYTAFGETTEESGTTVFPFLYVGRNGYFSDEFTSEYVVRRRIYRPRRGRWLSADPIGLGLEPAKIVVNTNLYDYVGGLPTLLDDPSGLKCPGCPVPWKVQPVFGVTFQYGCYCGREAPPFRPPATIPPPIDPTDACCQAHDICCGLAKTIAARTACNAALCTCAGNAFATDCPAKAPDIRCCCQAGRDIVALYCVPGPDFC